MADFNVSLQQPQAAGARPLEPVTDYVKKGVDPYVGLASNLTGIFLQNMRENAAFNEDAIVGEFVREQAKVADAYSQGSIKADRAKVLTSANFNKYAAQYPQFVDKFNKANTAMRGNTAINAAEEAVKSEEQFQSDQIKAMAKMGLPVYQGMSQEAYNANLDTYSAMVRADESFKRMSERGGYAMRLGSYEREVQQHQDKQVATNALLDLGDKTLNSALVNTKEFLNRAASGENPEVVAAELQTYIGSIERVLVKEGYNNPELYGMYKSILGQVRDVGMNSLKNNTPTAQAENALKELQARIQLSTLASPENKALYGTVKILGQLPATFFDANYNAHKTYAELVTAFGGAAPYTVGKKDRDGSQTSEKVATSFILDQIGKLPSATKETQDAAKQQLMTGIKNYTNQVTQAASRGLTANELKEAAAFYSDPRFLEAQRQGLITPNDMQGALKTFESTYFTGVEDQIVNKLSAVAANSKIPLKDLVDFKFNGATVTVTPRQDRPYLTPTGKQDLNQYVREFNVASSALDQMIKIGAHMQGTTDYAAYWEENKHKVLKGVFLEKGTVKDGYEYIGPDPVWNKNAWRKVNASSVGN